MQPKGRNSRSEVFYISKSFKKAVTLPPARAWRVKETDVAARGYVLCITKSKGLFFDKMTNLEPRLLTLTRSGLLIIYNKEDKGYVVDVKDAKVMTTKTDHFRTKQQSYRRCTLKLKFKYGSVSMIMFNEEIPAWRTAIATAHDGLMRTRLHFIGIHRGPTLAMQRLDKTLKNLEEAGASTDELKKKSYTDLSTSKSPDVQDSAASIKTCIDAEGVIEPLENNSEVTVDMPEDSEPTTVIETHQRSSPSTKKPLPTIVITQDENSQYDTFDPTVCDSSYQWLHREIKKSANMVQARACVSDSTNSGLFTELTDGDGSKAESAKSVRCGYTSVATLRSRLEAKMQGKKFKRVPKPTRIPALNQPDKSPIIRTHIIDPGSKEPTKTNQNSSMRIKLRPVARSQSESDLETAMKGRSRQRPPTSYDDSLLGVSHSERAVLTTRPTLALQKENDSMDKYGANQWWANPLRV
nr:Protein R09E10.6 [Haemonchus contortus]